MLWVHAGAGGTGRLRVAVAARQGFVGEAIIRDYETVKNISVWLCDC